MTGPKTAAERWRDDLASWAIPQDILDKAPVSPWHHPVALFASIADSAVGHLTFSSERALEALPHGGAVLDVGCGAGGSALPLAGRAGKLVGFDTSRDMLDEFERRARAAGVEVETVEGRWPDAAAAAPVVDVAVCHHVAYNVPELDAFAVGLTGHARHRAVMELTAQHPLTWLNDLWMQFHGLARPDRPTADDAEAVLREAGLDPHREDWVSDRRGGFPSRQDVVAFARRILCLGPERDPEVEAAIAGRIMEGDGFVAPAGGRPVTTLWWPGRAS
jgi:SAM-dependent methyltransferase